MTELEYERKFILLKNLPGEEERGSHAVELLENKYGKEFGYLEVRTVDVNDDFYKVINYPIDNPELLFESRISLDGEKLMDEYAVKVACDEYCNNMIKKIMNMNGLIYSRLSSLIRGFELDDTELSINKLQEKNHKNCYILDIYYTAGDNAEDDLYSVINNMLDEDEKMSGIINVYVLPEKIREKVLLYLESHDKAYMDFAKVLDKNRPFTVEMEKGRISLSKDKWEERMGNRV